MPDKRLRFGGGNILYLVWGITVVLIGLIVWLGGVLYRTTEQEMADQFNRQQLILAREAATGIEEYLKALAWQLEYFVAMTKYIDDDSAKIDFYRSFRSGSVTDIWEFFPNGVINFSVVHAELIHTQIPINKYLEHIDNISPGEIQVSTIFRRKKIGIGKSILLVTPLTASGTADFSSQNFLGFLVSVEKIMDKFAVPIRSGDTGYAWVLDENGVLLHHSEHPEMIDRSIFMDTTACRECHRLSFALERKIVIEKKYGNTRYRAASGQDKLIAFSPIYFGRYTWTIAVAAPYSEVTYLVRKSLQNVFLLSGLTISGILIVNLFIIRLNKKRVKAEEKALYADQLEREVQERTAQIHQEKQKLTNIVSAIGAELSVIDPEFRVLWANEKVRQRFTSRGARDGSHCYKLYYQLEQPCPDCPARQTFRGAQIAQVERALKSEGQNLIFQITTTPIRDETGHVIHVLELAQDITLQKQQEQSLMLSKKMSAVGQIAIGLAHDLGNPLTIIAGSSQFCLQNLVPPESLREYLEVINRNASAAGKVIKALLQFARPTTEAVWAPLNLVELAQRALLLLHPELLKHRIQVREEYPDTPTIIYGDRSQLEQVFVNIILNATEAMSNVGELKISLQQDPDNRLVHLYFSDTGPGIPPEHLETVFEPFFTTRVRGVGLGLSISKKIVEAHSGIIEAKNKPEGGTLFVLTFPQDKPDLPNNSGS